MQGRVGADTDACRSTRGVHKTATSLTINVSGEAADVKREVGVERRLQAWIPYRTNGTPLPLPHHHDDALLLSAERARLRASVCGSHGVPRPA
jgi:hypothetical protein